MNPVLFVGILFFGCASYVAGTWHIIADKYKPSVFSRVVWLLLAINSFAGVVASDSSKASLMLSIIFLFGNVSICIGSFWKGTLTMGRLEYVCLAILVLSGLVWVFFNAPLVNLSMGLFAYFIGGLPTYRHAWKDSSTESTAFWSYFFIANVLGVIASLSGPAKDMIFPIYFTIFDGGMTALSLRKTKAIQS